MVHYGIISWMEMGDKDGNEEKEIVEGVCIAIWREKNWKRLYEYGVSETGVQRTYWVPVSGQCSR